MTTYTARYRELATQRAYRRRTVAGLLEPYSPPRVPVQRRPVDRVAP